MYNTEKETISVWTPGQKQQGENPSKNHIMVLWCKSNQMVCKSYSVVIKKVEISKQFLFICWLASHRQVKKLEMGLEHTGAHLPKERLPLVQTPVTAGWSTNSWYKYPAADSSCNACRLRECLQLFFTAVSTMLSAAGFIYLCIYRTKEDTQKYWLAKAPQKLRITEWLKL